MQYVKELLDWQAHDAYVLIHTHGKLVRLECMEPNHRPDMKWHCAGTRLDEQSWADTRCDGTESALTMYRYPMAAFLR
eukprot:551348-Prymnesium_polylepis.1